MSSVYYIWPHTHDVFQICRSALFLQWILLKMDVSSANGRPAFHRLVSYLSNWNCPRDSVLVGDCVESAAKEFRLASIVSVRQASASVRFKPGVLLKVNMGSSPPSKPVFVLVYIHPSTMASTNTPMTMQIKTKQAPKHRIFIFFSAGHWK